MHWNTLFSYDSKRFNLKSNAKLVNRNLLNQWECSCRESRKFRPDNSKYLRTVLRSGKVKPFLRTTTISSVPSWYWETRKFRPITVRKNRVLVQNYESKTIPISSIQLYRLQVCTTESHYLPAI